MEKLKILAICALMVSISACNGNKEKNRNDSSNRTEDSRNEDFTNKASNSESHMEEAPLQYDWGRDYDSHMDITGMYGNLNMTDSQIRDYESATKNYRDNLYKENNKNTNIDNQIILVRRDSSLQSLLTPEQYKKYKEMSEKRKND